MKPLILFFLSCMLVIFQASAQNENISGGNVFEGEPFLAMNPKNPNNLVVAWMGYAYKNGSGLTIKIKNSFDRGKSWSQAILMPHVAPTCKSADPSMVFDQTGKLYLSYIDYRESPDSGGVYVYSSADGGSSWSSPVKVLDVNDDPGKSGIDRPWLASSKDGSIMFMTSKPAPWINPPNRAYSIASVTKGQNWQNWRFIDTMGYLIGNLIAAPMAAPAIAGKACLAVYPSYVASQNIKPQFILAKSKDAGNHFTYSNMLALNKLSSNDSAKLGYQLVVDPTDSNHYVFIYPYEPSGDIDVMLIESTNGGFTWTAPLRLNDDSLGNGKMQDMMWAAFDTDGDLAVTWRDRRNSTGRGYATASEMHACFRKKGTNTFQKNFKISDSLVGYNNILSQSGNDFMSMVLFNDTLHAVWGSTKNGTLNIWYTKTSATGVSTGILLIQSESDAATVYPNPSRDVFNVQLDDDHAPQKVSVTSITGKLIFEQRGSHFNGKIDLTGMPSGIYLFNYTINDRVSTLRLMKTE